MARKIVDHYLNKYGSDILESEEFEEAMNQTHHHRSSVGVHTMGVAVVSIWVCYMLSKIHVETDTEDVVTAALCHDLGIVGRDEKYESNHECYHQHPHDSVDIARKLVPHLSEKSEDIIRTHMWPMTNEAPTCREGVIVSVADKVVSVRDFFRFREPIVNAMAQVNTEVNRHLTNMRNRWGSGSLVTVSDDAQQEE